MVFLEILASVNYAGFRSDSHILSTKENITVQVSDQFADVAKCPITLMLTLIKWIGYPTKLSTVAI